MTLLDAAAETAAPPGRPAPQWRARVVAVCLALVTLSFLQDPGRIAADTKLDLTVDPWGFLGRALRLWDPEGFFGQLQNQAYGYLWPMGPFFGLGQALGLPDWVVQRLWWSLVLVAAFLGMYLLIRALGIGQGWPQILAALAYALAVRPQSGLGAISVEVWPMAVAPWVLLPLVRASRQGNVARAAALSALAVTTAGGVNAVAAGAVLPLAVWWLITLEPGPRRRRLAAWWSGLTLLAVMWWLIPLVVLGRYSPPFLDWIESARFTTSITDPTTVMRGADHWVAYLGDASDWTAGWLLATNPVLVVATGLVAAAGIAGLAMRTLPHRAFLVGAAIAGLVLVTAGHTGPLSGLGSHWVQAFLDGTGAPLRNVHKFDLVLRVPLTLGFCHVLSAVWVLPVRRAGWVRDHWRAAVAVVLTSALVITWWPALSGQLTRDRTYSGIAEAWRETAYWLNERAEPGRALIVPGASFGEYWWGRTQDEPLQAFGGYPWGVRDAVPLSSPGNIRMLDLVESRLESGLGSPGLAAYLERMGVRYLVVRNDLAPTVAAPAAIRVHQALDNSSGIRRVAWFGDVIGGGGSGSGAVSDEGIGMPYPAVEIYSVTPSNNAPDPRVVLRPAGRAVEVQGAPESLLALADTDALGNRPTFVASDPQATALAAADSFATDTDRRREMTFGYMRGQESPTMTADQPFVQDRPVHDYRVTGDVGRVVATPGDLRFTASSSASDVDAVWRLPRGATPEAAMDGALDTFWRPGAVDEDESYWEVRYPAPITLGDTLDVALLDDGSVAARSIPLQVITDAGSTEVEAEVSSGWQPIAAPPGPTSALRIVFRGTDRPQLRGLREVRLPGEGVSRLALPAATAGAGVLLTARPGDLPECAVRRDVTVCADALGGFSQDRRGLHRSVDLAAPLTTVPRIQTVVRDATEVGEAVDALSATEVTASSQRSTGLAGRPRSAFDRKLGTAWQAAPRDRDPWLQVTLPSPRALRGIRLVNRDGLNASSPLEVRVRAADENFTGFRDSRGLFRFGPVTTDTVRVTFQTASLVRSRSALGERILPVGVSEMAIIGADDLRQPIPPDALVSLPCGVGPSVVSADDVLQTSVTARVEQFEAEEMMWAEPCATGITLPAGGHRLDVRSTQTFRPVTAVFPPADYVGPTGRPVSPAVREWEPTRRVLEVPMGRAAQVLEVAENFNQGWTARAGERVLQPVRVDGWKQGFIVPAGLGGEMTLRFAPDGFYRIGLLCGLLAVLAVLLIAIRPPSSGAPPPTRPRHLPRVTTALVALGLLAVFGPLGLVLGIVVALLLGRAPLPAVAFTGMAAAAVASAVAGVRPGAPAEVLQSCLVLLAWAAVLRACWTYGDVNRPEPDAPAAHN